MSFFDDDSFFSEPKTPSAHFILRIKADDYRPLSSTVLEIAMLAFDPETYLATAEFERRNALTTTGLREIANWLDESTAPRSERIVWSRYAWFDPVVLADQFSRTGIAVPWVFNNQRDVNTLVAHVGALQSERFSSALAECRWLRGVIANINGVQS